MEVELDIECSNCPATYTMIYATCFVSKNETYNFQILSHCQLFLPRILQAMLVNNQFLQQIQSSSKNSS